MKLVKLLHELRKVNRPNAEVYVGDLIPLTKVLEMDLDGKTVLVLVGEEELPEYDPDREEPDDA